ncbi:MAG: hypothetical protein PHC88_08870 [Terrimicrobiaceae bacterium]|nr:hypothetical protein [Terrimicrobiaceae bacterium]
MAAYASRHALRGTDILGFLRTFEGAAATFAHAGGHWSLWLPEFVPDEHPLTPASQIFFPVILRHEEQVFAIRFFYDCATCKVRYYTSAIPDEVAALSGFENAISELFRHSLPIEPIRQRSIGRMLGRPAVPEVRLKPHPAGEGSPADPRTLAVPGLAVSASGKSADREVTRNVRVEIGPRARMVFLVLILTVGFVALAAVAGFIYLQVAQDPGVEHHRLQLEELRVRDGR